jgi:putative transposase
VVSVAMVVAVFVSETDERRVLRCETGSSQDRAFWLQLLRSLLNRGLKGVRLIISDAHEGFAKPWPTKCAASGKTTSGR